MNTLEHLQTTLARFGGVLRYGKHDENGECCAVELCRAARNLPWSDEPVTLDYRPLNDAPWASDAQRTEHMLPLMAALYDWNDWPHERQQRWAETVVLRTVREILPLTSKLPEFQACANVTLASAAAAEAARAAAAVRSAEETAEAARAAAAATAAEAAAEAAAAAARAAAAAADEVLVLACRIWREAAGAA